MFMVYGLWFMVYAWASTVSILAAKSSLDSILKVLSTSRTAPWYKQHKSKNGKGLFINCTIHKGVVTANIILGSSLWGHGDERGGTLGIAYNPWGHRAPDDSQTERYSFMILNSLYYANQPVFNGGCTHLIRHTISSPLLLSRIILPSVKWSS